MSDTASGERTFSIDEQISEARIEVNRRRETLNRLVTNHQMNRRYADARILAMQAVVETLERVRDSGGDAMRVAALPAERWVRPECWNRGCPTAVRCYLHGCQRAEVER